MPKADLDDVDKQLLSILRTYPFLTAEQLVEHSPLARNATYKHRKHLEERDYIKKGWIINPKKELLPYRCLVSLKLNMYELRRSPLKTTDELIQKTVTVAAKKTHLGKVIVEDVYHTFGEADLIFELIAENQKLAADFILEEIASHRGVTSTVTQTAFKWTKHAEWKNDGGE